jgi:dual specificity tyrosine-phosphorylation-regulated kinase 2/3/4
MLTAANAASARALADAAAKAAEDKAAAMQAAAAELRAARDDAAAKLAATVAAADAAAKAAAADRKALEDEAVARLAASAAAAAKARADAAAELKAWQAEAAAKMATLERRANADDAAKKVAAAEAAAAKAAADSAARAAAELSAAQDVAAVKLASAAAARKAAEAVRTQAEGAARLAAAAKPAEVAAGPSPVAAAFLKKHRSILTEFEQSEILSFPAIWYAGAGSAKIRGVPGTSGPGNQGYDDERGDYLFVAHDHLAYRYEVLALLGRGNFGVVLRCFDHKTQAVCAVKIIRNKKSTNDRSLAEVKILEHLRGCDPGDGSNIVQMYECFNFRSHLCITFEVLSMSLYDFAKSTNFQGMQVGLIRHFAQQLLVSLRLMRASHVLHCDLKPENVLLRAPNKPGIKLIDFGSSCFLEERASMPYMQSRFYRSPEVILGHPYDEGVDMWSLGCILAELFTGRVLFQGETETEQLACIMETMGLPPRALLEQAARRSQFFDSTGAPRPDTKSRVKRKPGSRSLATTLRCPDAGFVAFVQGCLRWDPRERLTPDAGLAHAWISDAAPQAPLSPPPSRERSFTSMFRGA